MYMYVYIYVSALQQTLTAPFSRESFLLVSTPVDHSRSGSGFVPGFRGLEGNRRSCAGRAELRVEQSTARY